MGETADFTLSIDTNPSFMPTILITQTAPEKFKELVWNIFFESRQRGISLDTHFPWLDGHRGFFVTVHVNNEIVGGLAVKLVDADRSDARVAIVGLVCVHADHRAQGHSTAAMQAAISEATRRGIDDLILWTGKPGVYAKLGFRQCDDSMYGWVTRPDVCSPTPGQATAAQWPSSADQRGLPPFAKFGQRWETADSWIITVDDGNGAILAEWAGPDEEVLKLTQRAMPARWRINTLEGDSLPELLRLHGSDVKLEASNLQMVLPLRAGHGAPLPYRFRLLDRI